MGLLVDGKWVDQWYDTESTEGQFKREESSFRSWIGSDAYPAEVGRYHLYVSYACPWAHRTLIFRALKDLEDVISYSVVDPYMGEYGWTFGGEAEPLNKALFLHQIYTLADPNFTGRVTVPVLWDKKTKTIVNNESAEIIRMFNTAFNGLTGNTHDYYPEDLKVEIDKTNDFIYDRVNNGVYKTGFATTQLAYEENVLKLFEALEEIEKRLGVNRYIVGETITEADWRLFTTLVRFDPVYFGHFKCNIKALSDFPNITHYVRELYQVEGVAETVNMAHIKEHYYASHKQINPTGIVPIGRPIDFDLPHNRARILNAA